MSDVAVVTTGWADRFYDPDAALLWNPPGSFTPELADRSVHMVPQSAWYVVGLLLRDGPGDRERARAILHRLCDLQYDRPSAVWHGTYARFAEWPEPSNDAAEWVDYDPNWRQFVGLTVLVILRHFEPMLDAELVARLERALELGIEGERDRLKPSYTNIAIMHAGLLVEGGERLGDREAIERGEMLAAAIVERFDRHGTFDEYNSPTYYGIDLLGLAFWRTNDVSEQLRVHARQLEQQLWNDIADWYHPYLGNLCGPYTRSYGMDMHRYVAALALWLWPVLGEEAVSLPSLEDEVVDHGHDLLLGPMVAVLGVEVPPFALLRLAVFEQHRVERSLRDDPVRVASGWLGHRFMIGAEHNEMRWHAWLQYFPLTVHWQLPDGDIGTVRAVGDVPVLARVRADQGGVFRGSALVEWYPHPNTGAYELGFLVVSDGEDGMFGRDRWDMPGLRIELLWPAGVDVELASVKERDGGVLVRYVVPSTAPAPVSFVLEVEDVRS